MTALADLLGVVERAVIRRAVEDARGRLGVAAAFLAISEPSLRRRIIRHGLRPEFVARAREARWPAAIETARAARRMRMAVATPAVPL